MKIDGYIPRIADRNLAKHLKTFGAVCIEGPKWCGKTWTALNQAASACMISDPADKFAMRKQIELDLNLAFIGNEPHLIDEWQEFPALWDATKFHVDQNRRTGQIILTGSSTPKMKGIMHSGTGRIGSMRLRPMSLWESGNSEGTVSLSEICNGWDIGVIQARRPALREIVELVMRGGWPGVINLPLDEACLQAREYVRRIIKEDIPRIDGKMLDGKKVELLMRSLARNESTVASIATLKSDISTRSRSNVNEDTIVSYLDVLTRLYILDNQEPFSTSLRSSSRLRKGEKRHFCDPSLACALLKATPEMLERDLETLGFLFESLVERDLRIYAEAFNASLYHYQDYDNREIDAVVELYDGRWAAIEIKLGASQEDKAAENLKRIAETFKRTGNPPAALIVILGLAQAAYKRKDGVYVVPITALKD